MADQNEINAALSESANMSNSENGSGGGVCQNGAVNGGLQSEASNPPQYGSAENSLNGHENNRKLFVGGLTSETTEKELREHFGQYGDIQSIHVKVDPTTGRSKGFAFIIYADPNSIDKVLQVETHVINNKQVDAKKAKSRQGKIFIGGLTPEISDDEIRTHFSQFGNIIQIESPFDKQKNQRKAFCFITFDSDQVANDLLKTPKQTISGKEVDVKKATSKSANMPVMNAGPHGGRKGGFAGNKTVGYGQPYGNQGYGAGQYLNYGGYGSNNYSGYGGYTGYQGGNQRGTRPHQRHQPY